MNLRVLIGGILFLAIGILNLLKLRVVRLGKFRDSREALAHQKEIGPLMLALGVGMVLWAVLDPESQFSLTVSLLTVVLWVVTLVKEFRYWAEMGRKR